MTRATIACATFTAVVVGSASIATVARQQSPGGGVVQFSVTVLDKNHHPVGGFGQSDFTVLEDGKAQPVTAFHQVSANEPEGDAPAQAVSASTAAWTREIQSDVATNALPAGRLFVLVLDDALIPNDPKIDANAKSIAFDLIDQLGPADQMAVLFTARSAGREAVMFGVPARHAPGFTADRAVLRAAVSGMTPGLAVWGLGLDAAGPGSITAPLTSDGALYQRSLQTLDDAANALAQDADRTKVIVYVTPGFPVENDMGSALASLLGSERLAANESFHRQLKENWANLFRDARRGNVPIYTIDPCGKGGFDDYLSRHVLAVSRYAADGQLRPLDAAHRAATFAANYLVATADNSGGRAIVKTDDFAPGIAAMFDEGGSHYVVAYAATDSGSGKFHHLKVTVDRPDLEVHTSSGYYASDRHLSPQSAPAPTKPGGRIVLNESDIALRDAAPLPSEAWGSLPVTGVLLRAVVMPFAGAAAGKPSVVARLDLQLPALAVAMMDTIEVQMSAFRYDEGATDARPLFTQPQIMSSLATRGGMTRMATEGIPSGSVRETLRVSLSPSAPNHVVTNEWLSRLELAPGHYRLRFEATDKTTGTAGSVFAEVDMPDAAPTPVSISGLVMVTDPARPASGADALAAFLPVIPTTQREFSPADAASVFVRVYEGGEAPVPATIAFRIVNAAGATAWAHSTSLASAYTTDVRAALPLQTLAPGDYLLTATAGVGTTVAARDVRFRIR